MKKAIIVDDSEPIRDKLKSDLEKNGFEVITAEDGLIGLEVIKNNQDCAIILVDINMPHMNGFEMLQALHKENLSSNTPKIILTTESILAKENSKKLVAEGKKLGIEAWVPKPSGEMTFAMVHEIIERIFQKKS